MSRGSLVLFARAPRLGVGKRRLARDVGDLAAWRFERAMLDRLFRRLGHDRRWHFRLAVAPDSARRRARLWPRGVPIEPQGTGDLGARMHRALARCPPGPAMLVGADIPALGGAHIAGCLPPAGQARCRVRPGGGWRLLAGRRAPSGEPRRRLCRRPVVGAAGARRCAGEPAAAGFGRLRRLAGGRRRRSRAAPAGAAAGTSRSDPRGAHSGRCCKRRGQCRYSADLRMADPASSALPPSRMFSKERAGLLHSALAQFRVR